MQTIFMSIIDSGLHFGSWKEHQVMCDPVSSKHDLQFRFHSFSSRSPVNVPKLREV